jgi:hypothetical protein
MKDMIKKTIETLKEKVKLNLLDIQKNQQEIRELLKQPISEKRAEKLEERYALNKVLLAENNDFINVQLTLTNFVDKYSNTTIFEGAMASMPCCLNESDCFEKTINGNLPFNQQHPFYNNDIFFQKLMTYYQGVENYEACGRIMKERTR